VRRYEVHLAILFSASVYVRAPRGNVRTHPTLWDAGVEEQIVDPTLAHAAKAKLEKMSPLHQEIVAAGTAREAYGLSVKTATKLSTTAPIVDEAGRLDRQDRPPVTKPRF
jgi:hypothetical protein